MKKFIKCANEINDDFDIENGVLKEYKGNDTHVVIPDGVTEIGEYAFYRRKSLTSILIPDSVIRIGKEAFYECSSLKSIEIPHSVTEIGNSAFWGCESLNTVMIHDGVKVIGEGTFACCSDIRDISIPNSVVEIGEGAFSRCNLSVYRSLFNWAVRNNEADDVAIDIYEENEDADREEFFDELVGLLCKNYAVEYFGEELDGVYSEDDDGLSIVEVVLKYSDAFSFQFDYQEQQSAIQRKGPKAAANTYFNEIKRGIATEYNLVDRF